MNWQDRISVKPDVCHGKACISGTRILVTVILDNLAEGISDAEILKSHPTLDPRDIQAAIHYASELASGRAVNWLVDEAMQLPREGDEQAELFALRREIAIGLKQAERGELESFDPRATLARVRSRQSNRAGLSDS